MGFTVHFWTSQWKQFLTTMLLSCDHQRPTLCSNTMSTISWENVSLYFTWKTGSVHPILSPLYFDLSFVFSFMLVRSIPLFLLLCTSRVFLCLSLYSLSVCSFSGVSTIPSVPCTVGWSDLALFCDFRQATHFCRFLLEFNAKKSVTSKLKCVKYICFLLKLAKRFLNWTIILVSLHIWLFKITVYIPLFKKFWNWGTTTI